MQEGGRDTDITPHYHYTEHTTTSQPTTPNYPTPQQQPYPTLLSKLVSTLPTTSLNSAVMDKG